MRKTPLSLWFAAGLAVCAYSDAKAAPPAEFLTRLAALPDPEYVEPGPVCCGDREVHVEMSGDDNTADGSVGRPYRTINAAYAAMHNGSGDRMVVGAGTWSWHVGGCAAGPTPTDPCPGASWFWDGASADRPMWIIGAGADQTRFVISSGYGINLQGDRKHLRFSGFSVIADRGAAPFNDKGTTGARVFGRAEDVIFQDIRFVGHSGGVQLESPSNIDADGASGVRFVMCPIIDTYPQYWTDSNGVLRNAHSSGMYISDVKSFDYSWGVISFAGWKPGDAYAKPTVFNQGWYSASTNGDVHAYSVWIDSAAAGGFQFRFGNFDVSGLVCTRTPIPCGFGHDKDAASVSAWPNPQQRWPFRSVRGACSGVVVSEGIDLLGQYGRPSGVAPRGWGVGVGWARDFELSNVVIAHGRAATGTAPALELGTLQRTLMSNIVTQDWTGPLVGVSMHRSNFDDPTSPFDALRFSDDVVFDRLRANAWHGEPDARVNIGLGGTWTRCAWDVGTYQTQQDPYAPVYVVPVSDVESISDAKSGADQAARMNILPDRADVAVFLAAFSGAPCDNCDIDYNGDGVFPDTADIDAFINDVKTGHGDPDFNRDGVRRNRLQDDASRVDVSVAAYAAYLGVTETQFYDKLRATTRATLDKQFSSQGYRLFVYDRLGAGLSGAEVSALSSGVHQ